MIDRKFILRQLPTELRLSHSSRLSSETNNRLGRESSSIRLGSDSNRVGRMSGRLGRSREDTPRGATREDFSLIGDENERRG